MAGNIEYSDRVHTAILHRVEDWPPQTPLLPQELQQEQLFARVDMVSAPAENCSPSIAFLRATRLDHLRARPMPQGAPEVFKIAKGNTRHPKVTPFRMDFVLLSSSNAYIGCRFAEYWRLAPQGDSGSEDRLPNSPTGQLFFSPRVGGKKPWPSRRQDKRDRNHLIQERERSMVPQSGDRSQVCHGDKQPQNGSYRPS